MKCEMKVTKWDETPLSEDKKWSRADVEFSVEGDFTGIAKAQYVMTHREDGATYVGMMRFEGKSNDLTGTFIVKDEGLFQAGGCESTLEVLAGSGTEGFESIEGAGTYQATETSCQFELKTNLTAAT